MKATISIELQPFPVPNYVLTVATPRGREEGIVETPKYPLSDLDPLTLDRMCDDFREEVFRKAGKSPPPTMVPG